jgi:tryptophanyl-tRNA synthetase
MFPERVVSGMRPVGALHIGHYHGALRNWVNLQAQFPCFFFVADWHALAIRNESSEAIDSNIWEMVIDWLAAGIDPQQSTLFIQSRVPEHAELHLLLSMVTPLDWLQRAPLLNATLGCLGYPLLQAADVLMYRATYVLEGDDQAPSLELAREVARRFNHLYGREPGFDEKAKEAVKKLAGKKAKLYAELRARYQEQGDDAALRQGRDLLEGSQNISLGDRERLFGYLEGSRKIILSEPQILPHKSMPLIGLDGQKMSGAEGNTIAMREAPEAIVDKIRAMPTDPARAERNHAGSPEQCPVWFFHQVYCTAEVHHWVHEGCTQASIGCLDCKQPLIDRLLKEQQGFSERAQPYLDDPALVKSIVADGCDKARKVAIETMRDVREVVGLAA